MLAYKELKIKSKIKDYSVKFVVDYAEYLKEDVADNSFIIVDGNVLKKHGEKLLAILTTDRTIIINAIEKNKSFEKISPIIKTLLEHNIRRNDRLIAIGGGITQDITAFIASILFRGVDWVFYPTTLLAQCDSCIGSKTSINFGGYKNQLGTWYPPSKIISNEEFLKTLDEKEVYSGIGEIIKIHLIDGDKSYKCLKKGFNDILAYGELLETYVYRSLIIKKRFIEEDEFDKGRRNILNYGHTFGHAIETITDFRIPHGQAVILGMKMANDLSLKIGILSKKEHSEMGSVLDVVKPDYSLNDKNKKLLIDALLKDKKNVDGNITAILTSGIGKMQKMSIPYDVMRDMLGRMTW